MDRGIVLVRRLRLVEHCRRGVAHRRHRVDDRRCLLVVHLDQERGVGRRRLGFRYHRNDRLAGVEDPLARERQLVAGGALEDRQVGPGHDVHHSGGFPCRPHVDPCDAPARDMREDEVHV